MDYYKDLLEQFKKRKELEAASYAPQEEKELAEQEKANSDYRLASMIGNTATQLGNVPSAWAIMKGREGPITDYSKSAEMLKPELSRKDILAKYAALKGGARSDVDKAELANIDYLANEEKSKRANELEMNKFNRDRMWDVQKIEMQQGLDKQKAQLSKSEEDKKRYIPGIGTALTPEDAKNIKDGKENLDAIKQGIAKVKDIRNQSGYEVFNTDNAKLGKQLATDLTLRIKNMAQLGQISASDAVILQNMVPEDPTSLRDPTPLFDQLEKMADASFENKLKSRLETRENPAQAQAPNDEDKQAMEWAQANPQDPRSKAILEKLGQNAQVR